MHFIIVVVVVCLAAGGKKNMVRVNGQERRRRHTTQFLSDFARRQRRLHCLLCTSSILGDLVNTILWGGGIQTTDLGYDTAQVVL